MATVHNQMTNLANEVRALSGTENLLGIVAMTEKVNEANTEISEQTNLISQMNTALDDLGAVAGGSGGGSGGTPETCTLDLTSSGIGGSGYPYSYQTVENGKVVTKFSTTYIPSVTVLCGGILAFTQNMNISTGYMVLSEGISIVGEAYINNTDVYMAVLQIDLSAGETGTITFNSPYG